MPTPAFPNISHPLVEEADGLRATRPWIQFFQRIWRLVGGSSGSSPVLTPNTSVVTPIGAGVVSGTISITLPSGTVLKLAVVTP